MKYKNHIEHYKVDAVAQDYFENDKFLIQEHRRRYQTIFGLLNSKNGNKILEIGSGGGHALNHIKSKKYFPLDISAVNLNKIQKTTDEIIFPATGDVYNLPFISNEFDNIILSEVLEHLENPEAALQEIFRVLKPNGRFVVSVPYNEKLSYQLCVHCNQLTPTNAHLHSFNENNLSELLFSSGFKIIRSKKFLNKISNRLHINIALRGFPFGIWTIIDQAFNKLIDKSTSIMFLCEKN